MRALNFEYLPILCAYRKGRKSTVAKKEILDKLSIYIPPEKAGANAVKRLVRLSAKRERSINYLVVDAILQYLKREEKKG